MHDSDNEARRFGREDRLRLAEAASGIGTFEMDLGTWTWRWGPQIVALFGADPGDGNQSFEAWEKLIFVDDVPKIRAALAGAQNAGSAHVEFRVRHPDGTLHWLAAKGRAVPDQPSKFRGAIFEITERKALEARLLAVNETLEARVLQVREEARTLEVLNDTGIAVAAEHDLERLVQMVTDAGVELSRAEFGAFFYNVMKAGGESYTLYTLSGAPRERLRKISDAAKHSDLRADLSRSRSRTVRRHSNRPALRQKRPLPRHARRTSAGPQLSGGAGHLTLGRGAGRSFFRSRTTRAYSPNAPNES